MVQVRHPDRNHLHTRLGMIICKSFSLYSSLQRLLTLGLCSKSSNSILAPLAPYGTFAHNTISPEAPSQSQLSSFMLTELCFSRNHDPENLRSPHDAFQIPEIDPYVPIGTDPDIAATLTAIYRSHCTSLVECVRFMRLKQFHHLFVSFHGTLTVPVQNLLRESSVSPWIRESDWVMYKVS